MTDGTIELPTRDECLDHLRSLTGPLIRAAKRGAWDQAQWAAVGAFEEQLSSAFDGLCIETSPKSIDAFSRAAQGLLRYVEQASQAASISEQHRVDLHNGIVGPIFILRLHAKEASS